MFSLISMDELSRVIAQPWLVKTLEQGYLLKLLELFPFFGILYILSSLKNQYEKIENQETFTPPTLCNDQAYTWYRMNSMATSNKEVQESPARQKEETFTGIEPLLQVDNTPGNLEGNLSEINGLVESKSGMAELPVYPGQYEEEVAEIKDTATQLGTIGELEPNTEELYEKSTAALTDHPLRVRQYIDPNVKPINERIIMVTRFRKVSNQPLSIPPRSHTPKPEILEPSAFVRWLQQHTNVDDISNTGDPIQAMETDEALAFVNAGPATEDSVKTQLNGHPTVIPDENRVFKKKKTEKKEKKAGKKKLVATLVEQSLEEHDLLVSEPFAELLLTQGYKERALKIYQKLIEKIPGKAHIFAAKIESIHKDKI